MLFETKSMHIDNFVEYRHLVTNDFNRAFVDILHSPELIEE